MRVAILDDGSVEIRGDAEELRELGQASEEAAEEGRCEAVLMSLDSGVTEFLLLRSVSVS